MSGLESDSQMNLIRHASNPMRMSVHTSKNATKILMQSFSMLTVQPRFPALRAEDQMVMQGRVSGWHGRSYSLTR